MEVSSFTRQLLTDLKEQFIDRREGAGSVQSTAALLGLTSQQLNQVQTGTQTKREALGMSMLLARNKHGSSEQETGSISDECYLFTHIVDCVRSLMEITESKKKPKEASTSVPTTASKGDGHSHNTPAVSDSSLLYSGFISHIERVVKDLLLPSSEVFLDCATSPINDSLNRCVTTAHCLTALPTLSTTDSSEHGAKKLPLLHYAAYNTQSLDLVKLVLHSNEGGVRGRDKAGALPLHWAILNTQVSREGAGREQEGAGAGEQLPCY
jgi:hypothetical protein